MNGETTRDLLLILVMAVVTFATRLLPFLLFDRGEEPPKAVLYLGRVLPPAIIAMLIDKVVVNTNYHLDIHFRITAQQYLGKAS